MLGKIGPFDGLVGTVIEKGELFITSANQNHIPLPPLGSKRPLTLRTDSLYGDDDPIQWPQPFNANFPHYSCIPRRNARPADSIIWWEPTRDSFISGENALIGLGKLSLPRLVMLEKAADTLVTRVEAYLQVTPAVQVPKPLGPLTQMMRHSLTRLKSVAMSVRQMMFQVRDVQRSWLEIVAMLDYMEIYRPRMNATTGSIRTQVPPTADTMGAFTSDLRVAQDHFAAGLPYWLIRPASAFADQNILEPCDPEPPHSINLYPDPFRPRVLADGRAGTDIKYDAIHRYARNLMRYPDPFNYNTTVNINDPSTTTPVPIAATSLIPRPSGSGVVRSSHEKHARGKGNNKGRSDQGRMHGKDKGNLNVKPKKLPRT